MRTNGAALLYHAENAINSAENLIRESTTVSTSDCRDSLLGIIAITYAIRDFLDTTIRLTEKSLTEHHHSSGDDHPRESLEHAHIASICACHDFNNATIQLEHIRSLTEGTELKDTSP